MYLQTMRSLSRVFVMACVAIAPTALAAQATAKAAPKVSPEDYASRWDILAGYSYLAPHGTVQVPQPEGQQCQAVRILHRVGEHGTDRVHQRRRGDRLHQVRL